MSDPKLKRTTVVVGYSCDDGFSKKSTFKSTKEVPHKGLLSAIYELSRMAALYGVSDLADESYSTAKDNIADFLSLKEIAHNSEEVSKQMQEDLGVSLIK